MASGVGGRWVVGWEEREKGGTEQGGMGEVAWLRGEEKDPPPACFCFNGNFNGKMAKNRFLAIKSSRSVLQPSSYHC